MNLKESKVPLNGLVLAGGKSKRMGTDKGLLQWHGQEQRYYMAHLLQPYCEEVSISCRRDQADLIERKYKPVVDEYENGGPLCAIVSAFHQNKNTGWLVVACDLPLLDGNTLGYLIQNRNASLNATTFKSPHDELPEPLVTIWEPSSLPYLEAALLEGKYCPRKALMKVDIELLEAPEPTSRMNANTPEDGEKILQALQKKSQGA